MKRIGGWKIAMVGGIGLMLSSGCQDISGRLPSGFKDPKTYKTAESANEMARGARYLFQQVFLLHIQVSGGLSDEFREANYGDPIGTWNGTGTEVSSRMLPESRLALGRIDASASTWPNDLGNYAALHRVRSQARQAREALRLYSPEGDPAVRGEMYLYEAFAVVYLGELFCSGVPLTTVDFEADVSWHPGASTEELFTHAIALFDTAIALSGPNHVLRAAASVGKARAFMSISKYQEAREAVGTVASITDYSLPILRANGSASSPNGYNWRTVWGNYNPNVVTAPDFFTFVADRKGENGLPYLTGQDPRIRVEQPPVRVNRNGVTNSFPAEIKAVLIATRLEAELILAEVALRTGSPQWLALLNAIRTDGYTTIDTVHNDTLWHAGSGGVAGLAPVDDPGASVDVTDRDAFASRLALVFSERAYWLFATGHRQGDLRRLVREDGWPRQQVYPWGTYAGGDGSYGEYIDLPIPSRERIYNRRFTGCFWRD